MAALTVSGCVTVERGPDQRPPAPPARLTGERADRKAAPRIVQAPVREALEAALPPVRPPRASTPAPAPAPRRPDRVPQPRPRPTGHRPAPPAPAPAPPPVTGGDVCDLGRSLGGWTADSPESRICDETYRK
ncbi:hypothetical protein AB0G73_13970 [Streptomyces sp. NPDC020719]|uniref:hypothetical protein n=1 Tax=Streptomyces sp. NPDC020719 TaxID=3154896 RepID=UPI00340A66AE